MPVLCSLFSICKANSDSVSDIKERCKYGYYCIPLLGACLYNLTHTELFVPAGHGALNTLRKHDIIYIKCTLKLL